MSNLFDAGDIRGANLHFCEMIKSGRPILAELPGRPNTLLDNRTLRELLLGWTRWGEAGIERAADKLGVDKLVALKQVVALTEWQKRLDKAELDNAAWCQAGLHAMFWARRELDATGEDDPELRQIMGTIGGWLQRCFGVTKIKARACRTTGEVSAEIRRQSELAARRYDLLPREVRAAGGEHGFAHP